MTVAMRDRESAACEPDWQTARQWWPDLNCIWTPIGWKNHLFRFNVFWNGVVLAQPCLNRRTKAWDGLGVQVSFVPWVNRQYPLVSSRGPVFLFHDDHSVKQGWHDGAAPVLWSEWADAGLLLREEVFGHIAGGADVRTGIEPLFAWVRLSVHGACAALPLEPQHGFFVKINAPHYTTAMTAWRNVIHHPGMSAYPRALAAERDAYDGRRGLRLIEDGGNVRLAIAPGRPCEVALFKKHPPAGRQDSSMDWMTAQALGGTPTENDVLLYIQLDAKPGTHVDLLIPMLPTERKVFDRELALGYDRALAEANRYWSRKPAAVAGVSTPEAGVNETIRHSLKFAEVIAEKNPADSRYSLLVGSLAYADLWATPAAMGMVMLLQTYGYAAVLEKYLEIFRAEQGTVKPPGDAYLLHSGYFSTPKSLTSIDWLSDHGALMYAIASHGLLTADPAFIGRWTEPLVKACDFVKDARRIEGHGGYPGIMPPAVATDRQTKIQAVWNDGWTYKGFTTAIRLLARIGHPRADEFAAEAAAYRTAFQEALRDKCRKMPTWTDRKGRTHPFVPTALFGDVREETRHAFYLDAGPLFLVFSRLMDATDPLMRSTLLWFREGPQTEFFREESDCWQVPCLRHEMSSCEPCYSWNVFHSHQLGDRAKYLEGMYSLLAGAVSRKTFISCETRHGQMGNLFAGCLLAYLARLAAIDETIRENEVHLLRFAPRAWLRSEVETRFDDMPTEFGPVTLRFRLSRDGRTLKVTWKPAFRTPPKRIVLHVPPVEGLTKLLVNGKALPWKRTVRSVVLA